MSVLLSDETEISGLLKERRELIAQQREIDRKVDELDAAIDAIFEREDKEHDRH